MWLLAVLSRGAGISLGPQLGRCESEGLRAWFGDEVLIPVFGVWLVAAQGQRGMAELRCVCPDVHMEFQPLLSAPVDIQCSVGE